MRYVVLGFVLAAFLAGCGDFEWFPGTASPLAIGTTALPAASPGKPYSALLVATGGKSPYAWSVSSGSLPQGLTLSPFGIVSGTPTVVGSYAVTLKVTDSASTAGTATKDYTITVSVLAIAPASLPAAPTGIAYSQTLTASGGTSPYTWTVSSGTLPPGLTLSAAGVLSGTPEAVATSSAGTGNVTFAVAASDSTTPAPQTGSQSYSLLVPTLGRMYDASLKVYGELPTVFSDAQNTTITISTIGNTDSSAHDVTVVVAAYDASGNQLSQDLTVTAPGVPANGQVTQTKNTFSVVYTDAQWRIKEVRTL